MGNFLLQELKEQILHLTIHRPEKRNALNQEVVAELISSFKSAAKDARVRTIILSGSGSESFCAGADLSEMLQSRQTKKRLKFFSGIAEIIGLMHKCPKPIIAKVHGYALAGGCGLAAAADITLASDKAIFGLPEINIGLLPMIVSLPIERSIGRKALAHLMLTGESINAEEALRIGLVNKVFPASELDAQVIKLANSLAGKIPQAMQAGKKLLYEIAEKDYELQRKNLPARITRLSQLPEVEEKIGSILKR